MGRVNPATKGKHFPSPWRREQIVLIGHRLEDGMHTCLQSFCGAIRSFQERATSYGPSLTLSTGGLWVN